MASTLARRGPDAKGACTHGNVALGHRRLAIIDTTEASNQPLKSQDGRFITVFNGEIYNFQQLRAELEARGHGFRTASDTEVLLHAYREYGAGMLRHLRGMFALAVLDTATGKLLLARDRLGQKPLYYADAVDGFYFASELKAIGKASPGSLGDIDPVALSQYATLGCSAGSGTIYRGARKLPPGHYMVVDTREAARASAPRRYWKPEIRPDADRPEDDWLGALDEVLAESVRLRMISDVPLGAFLSGGIDSSLITAYMKRQSSAVRTFSIGFRERSHDETEAAGEIAGYLRTDHHTQYVEPSALEILPELVDAFDEPFADSSAIPTYYLSKMTRQHVTVALSGDGGDESHLGYNRYIKGTFLQRYNRWLPPSLRAALSSATTRFSPGSRAQRALWRLPLRGAQLYLHLHGVHDVHLRLLRGAVNREAWRHLESDIESQAGAAAAGYQYADLRNYLPDDILVKVDRMSMWHSLEVRCPLLDHRFVELSLRVPPSMKLRGLQGKLMLRKLLARELPRRLFAGPKKGFSVPLASWFRGQLAPALDEMVADRASETWRYFDLDVARRYVALHRRPDTDLSSALWRLLFFHTWMSRRS